MWLLQDHAPFLKSVQHICINNPFLKRLYLKCRYSDAEESTEQTWKALELDKVYVIAFMKDYIISSILKDLHLIMG